MLTEEQEPLLLGGTPWTPLLGWDEEVHPWMSAYCGYMALALHARFPETSLALEYYHGLPAHALVHKGKTYYDARGALPRYESEKREECEIVHGLEEKDLQESGLLRPKRGVRELSGGQVLPLAHRFIEKRGYRDLQRIPPWPS